MAVYTPADFISKWNTRFGNNDLFDIEEADLREFAADIKDSFSHITAGGKFKGLYVDGAKEADTYWLYLSGSTYKLARTKAAFTSAAAPVAGPWWELVPMGGSSAEILATTFSGLSVADGVGYGPQLTPESDIFMLARICDYYFQNLSSLIANHSNFKSFKYQIPFPTGATESDPDRAIDKNETITKVTASPGITAVEYRKNAGAWTAVAINASINLPRTPEDIFYWRTTYGAGTNSGQIGIIGTES
ncbi:MAG: hypothetical protein ACO1OQ_12820 [Rufibacter sp.]